MNYHQVWQMAHPLETEARQVSSGTLATLTGVRSYSDLDIIQHEFIEFCQENEGRYENWAKAWEAYQQAKKGVAP